MRLSDMSAEEIRLIGFTIMGAGAIAFACAMAGLIRLARRR